MNRVNQIKSDWLISSRCCFTEVWIVYFEYVTMITFSGISARDLMDRLPDSRVYRVLNWASRDEGINRSVFNISVLICRIHMDGSTHSLSNSKISANNSAIRAHNTLWSVRSDINRVPFIFDLRDTNGPSDQGRMATNRLPYDNPQCVWTDWVFWWILLADPICKIELRWTADEISV